MALDIALLQGLRAALFLMSGVSLYMQPMRHLGSRIPHLTAALNATPLRLCLSRTQKEVVRSFLISDPSVGLHPE